MNGIRLSERAQPPQCQIAAEVAVWPPDCEEPCPPQCQCNCATQFLQGRTPGVAYDLLSINGMNTWVIKALISGVSVLFSWSQRRPLLLTAFPAALTAHRKLLPGRHWNQKCPWPVFMNRCFLRPTKFLKKQKLNCSSVTSVLKQVPFLPRGASEDRLDNLKVLELFACSLIYIV